jgi:hypothetical protein
LLRNRSQALKISYIGRVGKGIEPGRRGSAASSTIPSRSLAAGPVLVARKNLPGRDAPELNKPDQRSPKPLICGFGEVE